MNSDWLILIPLAFLGLLQLKEDGKLNLMGILIDPLRNILSLFRK